MARLQVELDQLHIYQIVLIVRTGDCECYDSLLNKPHTVK